MVQQFVKRISLLELTVIKLIQNAFNMQLR